MLIFTYKTTLLQPRDHYLNTHCHLNHKPHVKVYPNIWLKKVGNIIPDLAHYIEESSMIEGKMLPLLH
jgi:hypothetical protein